MPTFFNVLLPELSNYLKKITNFSKIKGRHSPPNHIFAYKIQLHNYIGNSYFWNFNFCNSSSVYMSDLADDDLVTSRVLYPISGALNLEYWFLLNGWV